MDADQYQKWAITKAAEKTLSTQEHTLLNAALGLAGEAGETADIIKKVYYHGHDLDDETVMKLIYELGDCLWYIALAAQGLHIPLQTVIACNMMKLNTRYPTVFKTEESINRVDDESATVATVMPTETHWVWNVHHKCFACEHANGSAVLAEYNESYRVYVYGREPEHTLIDSYRKPDADSAKASALAVLDGIQ